jgi:hemerythrin-like domain-containing protein
MEGSVKWASLFYQSKGVSGPHRRAALAAAGGAQGGSIAQKPSDFALASRLLYRDHLPSATSSLTMAPTMIATELLRNEHRLIERVLTCLEQIAERALLMGSLDGAFARQALEFFTMFADRCHQHKEEDYLFLALEARGFSRHRGPTGVMFFEHDQGRCLLESMEETLPAAAQGQPSALARFAEQARSYCLLMRQHILKEDRCLFPMAERVLTEDDQAELFEAFSRAEHRDLGDDAHEFYRALADQLTERYDVPCYQAF